MVGAGDGAAVVVLQVPADGVGAGVQAGRGELLPDLGDQVDGLGRCRVRSALRAPGAGLERGLALDPVTGEQLVEPGSGDAVLGGDLTDRTLLDHHGGDHQTGKRHARTLQAGQGSARIS